MVRPGGTLHFLEHGLSPDPAAPAGSSASTRWQQRVAGGCHLTRDAGALVEESGMSWSPSRPVPCPGFSGPAALTYGYLGVATV